MKKKISLFLGFMLVLTLLAGCGQQKTTEPPKPADSQKTITFRLGHVCQTEHPYHYASKYFADQVAEKSKGRIKIDIYPARQLGGDRDMLEMIINGSLDMGSISTCIFGGFTPLLDAYQLPFLIDSYEVLDKAIPGKASDELLKGLEAINVKGLGVYDAGMRYLVMRKSPINSLADMKGLKLRVSEAPLLVDIFNAIGASPVPMPYGEIYSALQTGVIDGIEMDLSALVVEKHFEVAKYVTESGHYTWPFALIMNKKAWDSLSAEDKKIFEEAAKATYAFNHQNIRELDAKSLAFLKEKGVQFNKLSAEAVKAFREAEKPVYEKYTKKDARIQAFVDEVNALKK
ncbi:MAG: TRAP transporter substrate-binding protein [Bacillota bacterium]